MPSEPAAATPLPSRRVLLLVGLLIVLAAVAVWRVRNADPPEPDPPPDADRFQSDAALLARAGSASLTPPARPSSDPDWPQWRGPARDGAAPAAATPDPWPAAGPRELWSVPGGSGHSGLAVVGGRVYTMAQQGDEETTLCLDADTGATIWRSGVKAKFDEPSAGPGPHATPTVSGSAVYVVGATGLFRCLDATTGTAVWQIDLCRELGGSVPTYGVSTSPLVDGDSVIVVQGPVASFDRRTGKLIWKSGKDRPAHSSAVLATLDGRRQIVAVTGQSLVGLNPDGGASLWSFPWQTRGDYNIATPLIAGNYVFISSGYGKGCALVEVARGEARAVYEHNRMRNVFSSCVLHGDQVYGFDENLLVCMDLRTGAIRWKQRGFEKGSVVRVGNRIVVLGENGRLALIEPTPEAYRELASAEISKTRCWAPPSPARGKLYFRDQETVRCFDLAGAR